MSSRRSSLLAVVSLALAPMLVATAQSTVTVSPFMSYVPSAATNPLAGFSLTFGGTTGLALRGGAELSVANPDSAARANGGNRPWGADADIMMFLGGLGGGATVFSRALSPYLFTGIGLMGSDSAGTGKYVVQDGWSYGLGTNLPLGLDADLFGEARWRMPKYVLPTADDAPDSKSELRFGLSFHVGRGSNIAPPRRQPRRRQHLYNDDDDPNYEPVQERVVVREVPAPAPAPQPQVVVVQPAPAPPPQVIVVQQPAPEPPRRERSVNINVPLIIFGGTRTRERETVIIRGSECSRRNGRTRCSNDNHYSVPLSAPRVTETVVQVVTPSVTTKSKRAPSRR